MNGSVADPASATEAPRELVPPSTAQRAVLVASLVVGALLRVVGLGATVPTFDESFTGMAAQRGVADLLDFLAAKDSHPPLDYLLRLPVASTGDVAWLRAPSAVVGLVTLGIVAGWMWRRGWFGVTVVALTAIAPLQVLSDRQARMYALAILGGTLAASAAHRWLERPSRRWTAVAAGGVAIALWSHVTGLLLVLGLLLVVGLRRDRAAWEMRAAIGAVAATWMLAWGPSVLEQLEHDPASWIPLTTPRNAIDAVGGQLALFSLPMLVVAVCTVAGGVAITRIDRSLARVWWCAFAVPASALILAGVQLHVVLPRSLAVVTWGPVLAVASLVQLAAAHPRLVVRWGVAAVVAIVVVPSTLEVLRFEEESAPVRHRLSEVRRPGDAIAVHPAFLGPMLQWDAGLEPAAGPPPGAPDLAGDDVWIGAADGELVSGGRLWLVVPQVYPVPELGLAPCPDVEDHRAGDLILVCRVLP